MDPSGQKIPQVEGQVSGVEVPSKEAKPVTTEQLDQTQPVEQVGTITVLNKPEAGALNVGEQQPVQKQAPVENEIQTKARLGKIIDQNLNNPDTLTEYLSNLHNG